MSKTQDLLTVDDLAALLHRAPATIVTARTRCPHTLPPACKVPGTRRVLWRRSDVDAWLARHVSPPLTSPSSVTSPGISRRGRPTKAEQRQRMLRGLGGRSDG
jgi:predicted DNA-binding transcriptional regulator AlpA